MNVQSGVDAAKRLAGGRTGTEEALAPLVEINVAVRRTAVRMAQAAGRCSRRCWPAAGRMARNCPPVPACRARRGALAAGRCGLQRRGPLAAARAARCARPPAELLRARVQWRGARDFIRRVLMFSWHLARSQPQLARLVLRPVAVPACALSPRCACPTWTACRAATGRGATALGTHAGRSGACCCRSHRGGSPPHCRASLQGIQLLASSCLPPRRPQGGGSDWPRREAIVGSHAPPSFAGAAGHGPARISLAALVAVPAGAQGQPQTGIAPVMLTQPHYVFDTAEQHRLRVTVVARGLVHPFSVALLPDGDALVSRARRRAATGAQCGRRARARDDARAASGRRDCRPSQRRIATPACTTSRCTRSSPGTGSSTSRFNRPGDLIPAAGNAPARQPEPSRGAARRDSTAARCRRSKKIFLGKSAGTSGSRSPSVRTACST